MAQNFNYSSLIWGVAEKLRGTYRRSDNGKVILPFTVLRRLDCVLEASKDKVLDESSKAEEGNVGRDFLLQKLSGYSFYNTSRYDLQKAIGDPANLRQNLQAYISGFSPNVRDVFERYDFETQLNKLDEADLLLLVTQEFLKVDLHPEAVDNATMGRIFEDLIAKAMEASNEEAGEYFTPRDVVRLMVNLLFARDDDALSKPGVVRSIYDPTAGTGGMLSLADEYVKQLNPDAQLSLYGQELNDESFAIAKTDLLIKGQSADNMIWGDTLTDDGHFDKKFDYTIANPPFGLEWKKQQSTVLDEHERLGFVGRFGAGVPRVSDSSLLFLQHLVSKMRPAAEGGGRVAVVLNGSALTTGGAGSGESEIRRWLFEKDLVEAIIALPPDMFYSTDIATFVWVLDNDKLPERRGKVQLIDGSRMFRRLRKAVGKKKVELTQGDISNLVSTYAHFEESEISKKFSTTDLGFLALQVDRPLRVQWGATITKVADFQKSAAFRSLPTEISSQLQDSLAAAIGSGRPLSFSTLEEFISWMRASGGVSLKETQLKKVAAHFAEPDPEGEVILDSTGKPKPDRALRFIDEVALDTNLTLHFDENVKPVLRDAWIDQSTVKVGYSVPFARFFFSYSDSEPLLAVSAKLQHSVAEISKTLSMPVDGGVGPDTGHEVPELRESGIPWLGLIPAHWEVQPLLKLARPVSRKNKGMIEENLLSLSYGRVITRDINASEGLLPESFETYQIVEPGEIVFRFTDLQNDKKSLRSALVTQRGIITSAYLVLALSGINAPYFNHLMREYDLRKVFYSMGGGLRQSLKFDDIARMPIAIPPETEQQEIVRRLDKQWTAHDHLVSTAEELIRNLNVSKSSLLNLIVTGKG